MAKAYTQNQTPATGALAMYALKALLLAAGWVVEKSSDGTTYNATGDQISTGATGAGGLDNARAWFVIVDPSTTRRLCVQRTSATGANSSQSWRIKYSPSVGFAAGSPAATVTPSATDEATLLGSGSDSSPTFAAWSGLGDGAYRFNCMADSSAPYGFYAFGFPTGGGAPCLSFILDPLATGSFPALDLDPFVFILDASSSSTLKVAHLTSQTLGPIGTLKTAGVVSAAALAALAFYDAAGQVCPSSVGANGFNGYDEGFPIIYARKSSLTAPTGYKGASSLLTWNGTSRATGDLHTVGSAGDRVVVGDITLPWNGTAVTV